MNKRQSNKQDYTIKPMVGIANTNFDLIERCHDILESNGIGHIVSNHYRKAQVNNKPQKAIFVVGFKRVAKFISVFGGYIEKKKQLDCLRKLIEYRLSVHRGVLYGGIEENLYQELKNLNHKGILRDYTLNPVA